MTVPFPLDAFDVSKPVRPRRAKPRVDTDKLAGIAITLAVHVVIMALALTAVHVVRPKVMQELSVQISPAKIKQVEEESAEGTNGPNTSPAHTDELVATTDQ